MIRDEELGMVLRDRESENLDKVVEIASWWMTNKTNTKKVFRPAPTRTI